MNGNAFLSEKLLDDSSVVERSIIVQEEPVTWLSLVRPSAPKPFQKSVHHFSVEFRVKLVFPVQILGAWLPANRRKSPTWSSLETSGIEVSLAAANFLPPMQMIVVSSLGRQPSKKDSSPVTTFFKEVRITARQLNQILTCINSVFLFYSQCMRYKERANSLSLSLSLLFFFSPDLQRLSSVQYPRWCQAHALSSEVIGDDFAATAAKCFRCCRPLQTQRGDHFCGHLEHLPALHETVHTSKNVGSR